MSRAQDERCMKCIRNVAPAIRRAAVVRIWKEHLKGKDLKEILLEVAPLTDLDSLDGEPRFAP